MQTDLLQGIIFTPNNRINESAYDDRKFVKKYFKRILGYTVPGRTEVLNIERKYKDMQDDCDKLIAADLFERLQIISGDKIDIVS